MPLSHITQNVWSMLRVFQIVCYSLGVSPAMRVLLSFFSTKSQQRLGTLRPLSGRCLFKSLINSYEDWKDRFVRVREKGHASPVTTWAWGNPHFPLSWMSDPQIIQGVDPSNISPLTRKLSRFWSVFGLWILVLSLLGAVKTKIG